MFLCNSICYHGKGNLLTESNIQLFYQLFLGNTNSPIIRTAASTNLISQMTCSKKYLQNPLYARSHFQEFLGSPENVTPTAHDRNTVSQLNHFSSPCNLDFSFEHQHVQTLPSRETNQNIWLLLLVKGKFRKVNASKQNACCCHLKIRF